MVVLTTPKRACRLPVLRCELGSHVMADVRGSMAMLTASDVSAEGVRAVLRETRADQTVAICHSRDLHPPYAISVPDTA
eukprot:279331-Rhodomonas_salina.2